MQGDEIRALRRLQREQGASSHVFMTERDGPMTPKAWKYLRRSAGKSDSRKQSGSIKAQSSCHAISTSGLISAVSLRPGEGLSNAKPPVPPIDEQYRRRL